MASQSLMLRVSFPVRHFVTKLYFQFVHILHPACHALSSPQPIRCWPTYLAFVFIFSEIVLFLPWQLPWPARDPQSCKCPCPGPCLHLRGALGSSSGFTPPLGLLIIITSIMTGFHWAERNDSGNEYGYRDRDGDIDNVLSMSVPAARNEISLSLVHECQGFPLQIPFLQLMIFF